MKKKTDINEYIEALKSSRKFGAQIVCHKIIRSKQSSFKKPKEVLNSKLCAALEELSVTNLYSHQAEAIDLIRLGKDIVVATPTASGKSLIYNIPVLEKYFSEPSAHALYLFPLKALAQDQQRILTSLYSDPEAGTESFKSNFCSVYDGDTKVYQRTKLRKDPPPVIITNPEMVHLSMLPYHDSWSGFLKELNYVVIDEIHTYRGLFGAHMAWVLKRLIRAAEYYGSRPTFILLSATIGNPAQLGSKLIGRQVEVITRSGAPASRKHVIFLNPWDSAAHTTAQLLEAALKRGLRTIVYTKSRKMTELITLWTKPRIGELADKLSSYRAGFLPEDRRKIEKGLATGELIGVISTSALELGIDIGDLDLCILVGYPGSIMATWQRSGRVGRGTKESAVILIGAEDALDQHFMRNPEDFFNRDPEQAPLNPYNSKISRQHLHCAAAEISLDISEKLVTDSSAIRKEIDHLTEQSVLHQDAAGDRWYASRKRPQNTIALRGGGVQLAIIDEPSGEIIGEIDAGRALKEAHGGAIYLHHSRLMQVKLLDIDGREVVVEKIRTNFHTRAIVHKETEIVERIKTKQVFSCSVSWGKLKVTEQVTGFSKINNFTQKIASTSKLDLPEQVIETEGLWLDLDDHHRKYMEDSKMHFMGAIHAIEHAMISMFPLLILCDRNDIGGISCAHHEQTNTSSIFIYDGYSGGAGLTKEAFGVIGKLLEQTLKTIRMCSCENGCPSCVHSPKCGSGNRPIDKSASLELLQKIISETTPNNKKIFSKTIENSAPQSSKQSQQNKNLPTGLNALPEHYCVLDLETKRSAEEVGGWRNADKMGMSVGVVYDSELDGLITYFEEEIEQMINHLFNCQLVVGFNSRRFDYRVLSAYTDKNIFALTTLDVLEEIKNRLGYRLSLNRLVEETLGSKKSSDGLQALKWYKEGKLREIAQYCREDVKLTRNLFLYAVEHSHVLFRNKAGKSVRLPLNLDQRISQIVRGGN